MSQELLEKLACSGIRPAETGFNPACKLPYGVTVRSVAQAMVEFVDFLTFINTQLATRGTSRMETMMMPANFSSLVGEFMTANIPKFSEHIAKNNYHNGHPDLVPNGMYPNNEGQHVEEGIEVKASRYARGWQGHNAEDVWLMVFVYQSGRPTDDSKGVPPRPFRFLAVYIGKLERSDWNFTGRSETSRRTITASVTESGYRKMVANWLYRDPTWDGRTDT